MQSIATRGVRTRTVFFETPSTCNNPASRGWSRLVGAERAPLWAPRMPLAGHSSTLDWLSLQRSRRFSWALAGWMEAYVLFGPWCKKLIKCVNVSRQRKKLSSCAWGVPNELEAPSSLSLYLL